MKEHSKVHQIKPDDFNATVEVVACYLEIDGKMLWLQRTGSEAGLWGVPGGKMEKLETLEDAAKRELFEETGIVLNGESSLRFISSLFIRKPEIDYIYHIFNIRLEKQPNIILSNEHLDYKWATPVEIEKLPLMSGAKEALDYYRSLANKKRAGTSVNAYLILKKDDKILLQLRKNTGYLDGKWSLIAGHVEDGESATMGIVREAYEEIGIILHPSKIKVVHVLHRKSDRLNMDVFFECDSWEGEIQNLEPKKCEKLEFFPLNALPSNMVDYNATVLNAIRRNEFYSEACWD